MLVVHSDSRCDVCLDPYSWESTDKMPHAIACGHIFCFACLQNLPPAPNRLATYLCPLCRKGFMRDRVKKLHVDPQPSSNGDDDVQREASSLMERIALASGEHAPQADVQEVLEEVQRWLADHGNSTETAESRFPALRAAWAALVRYKDLQDRHAREKSELQALSTRYKHLKEMYDADADNALTVENQFSAKVLELEKKLAEQDEELKDWRRQFPAYAAMRHSYQDHPQNITVLAANPLPEPPRPVSYGFAYAKGDHRQEPRQDQGSSAYGRTNVPPLEPRPSNHGELNGEKNYPRPGVIIVRGASHENRFYPPTNHYEHARSRVRSDAHREGRERRSHHREAEDEREERRRRRRERERERALREARDAEAVEDEAGDQTLVAPDAIIPGNALGIDPSLAPPGDVIQRNASSSSRNPEGYVYATHAASHGGDRGQFTGPGTNMMVRMGSAQGPGSATTSFNIVGGHEPRSDAAPAASAPEGDMHDAARVPRMGRSTSSTSTAAGPVQWRPDGSSTSLAGIGLLNHPAPGPATTGVTPYNVEVRPPAESNAPRHDVYSLAAPQRDSNESMPSWGSAHTHRSAASNGSGFLSNLRGFPSFPDPSTDALAGGSGYAPPPPPPPPLDSAPFLPPRPDEQPRAASFSSSESRQPQHARRRDSQPARPGTSHADRAAQFYLPARPQTRQGDARAHLPHESQTSLAAAPGSRESLARAPTLPGYPYGPGPAPPQLYRATQADSVATLSSGQSGQQRWAEGRPR